MHLFDVPEDVLRTIISPPMVGTLGCTMMHMTCKVVANYINSADILGPRAICEEAAFAGYFELLKWARTEGYPCDHPTFTAAAAAGHVDVLEYLLEMKCPYVVSDATEIAAYNGHINVIKWLDATGCRCWTINTFYKAIEGGYLDILQYIHRTCPYVPSRIKMCDIAAKHGQINILEWLCVDNIEGCEIILWTAVENDNPAIFDWWISRGGNIQLDLVVPGIEHALPRMTQWFADHGYMN